MNSMNTASVRRVYQNHIDGRATAGAAGATFESVNPTTGGVWGAFVESDARDVDAAVSAAEAAFQTSWGRLSPTQRGRMLMRWGDVIAENAERIGRIETEQNGKLLAEMRGSAAIATDWLYYFGGLADKVEGAVIPLSRTSVLNYTLREPLGVVGVIVPWNSPTLLTIMSLAPALAAGNTVVVKPSEITSASAIELAKLAEKAGIPPGVINIVTGGRAAGEALVDHPGVAKVTFVGSETAGAAVASAPVRGLRSTPWSWAARARTSSSTTPTWTAPKRACSRASSPPPARPAWRVHAPSSTRRSSIASWIASCSAQAPSAWAIRCWRRPRWARCPARRSSRATSRWSRAPSPTVRRCSAAASPPRWTAYPTACSSSPPFCAPAAWTPSSCKTRSSGRCFA